MARHEKPATGSKINWKSGDKHAHGPAPPSPKAAQCWPWEWIAGKEELVRYNV